MATVLDNARPSSRTAATPQAGEHSATAIPPQRPAPGSLLPPDEAISRRAYEIFLERGGEHGNDIDDWLRAERELKTGHGAGAA